MKHVSSIMRVCDSKAFSHTAGTQMSWNLGFERLFLKRTKPKYFHHVLSLTFAAALMIRKMTTTLNASESLKGLLVPYCNVYFETMHRVTLSYLLAGNCACEWW